MKLISGGQTGVDRAALDVALKHGIDCGGWCPAGRLDEFGRIPDRYPLKELEQGSFADRTFRNVKDSDATIVIYCDELRGGTEFTVQCCQELDRQNVLINASKYSVEEAGAGALEFVRKNEIETLNIAGPRQSEWPAGYDYAFRALELFLTSCSGGRVARDL